MKQGKFDTSYDLGQAVLLARQLEKKRRQTHRVTLSSPTPTIDVVESESPPPTPVPAPIEAPCVDFSDQDVFRSQVWQLLLEWAVSVSNSSWAWASDKHGLVIAEHGQNDGLSAEEIGSGLTNAIFSLKRWGLPEILSLKSGNGWIAVLCCTLSEQGDVPDCISVGLLSQNSPDSDNLEQIHRVFMEKLTHLQPKLSG